MCGGSDETHRNHRCGWSFGHMQHGSKCIHLWVVGGATTAPRTVAARCEARVQQALHLRSLTTPHTQFGRILVPASRLRTLWRRFATVWLFALRPDRAVRQVKHRFRRLVVFWSVPRLHLHCGGVKRAELFCCKKIAASGERSGAAFSCPARCGSRPNHFAPEFLATSLPFSRTDFFLPHYV